MKTRTKTRPTKTAKPAKRQKTKMASAVNTGGRRIDALKRMLTKERADTLARVKELMREQARNGGQPPADEMDVARSLSEVETHAALFDRAQERLSAIDAAIARLGAGVYGTCARCGDEIPLARLQVIRSRNSVSIARTRRTPKLAAGKADWPNRSAVDGPDPKSSPVPTTPKSTSNASPPAMTTCRWTAPSAPTKTSSKQPASKSAAAAARQRPRSRWCRKKRGSVSGSNR